jgi:hypothetical protein
MEEHLALTTEEPGISVTPIKPPRGHVPDPKELAELEAGNETLVDPDVEEPLPKEDIDFGDFDKDA